MGRNEFTKHLLHGEGYRKTPELVEKFLEDLPSMEAPTRYVIFKPLNDLADGEVPVVVIFTADADQLSALVTLVNYDRTGNENVIAPKDAGCHQIGVYAFKEAESKNPKAVIGLTDISARRAVRGNLGKDVVTLSVPYNIFIDIESNVEGSFLERDLWKGMAGE